MVLSVDDTVLDKPYVHYMPYMQFVGHFMSGKHHRLFRGIWQLIDHALLLRHRMGGINPGKLTKKEISSPFLNQCDGISEFKKAE